ncbi:hypothetical protein KM043_015339 [Ampulex compressa]|nr:hypothetical protein KM043_015339 [Ampulex compressa]
MNDYRKKIEDEELVAVCKKLESSRKYPCTQGRGTEPPPATLPTCRPRYPPGSTVLECRLRADHPVAHVVQVPPEASAAPQKVCLLVETRQSPWGPLSRETSNSQDVQRKVRFDEISDPKQLSPPLAEDSTSHCSKSREDPDRSAALATGAPTRTDSSRCLNLTTLETTNNTGGPDGPVYKIVCESTPAKATKTDNCQKSIQEQPVTVIECATTQEGPLVRVVFNSEREKRPKSKLFDDCSTVKVGRSAARISKPKLEAKVDDDAKRKFEAECDSSKDLKKIRDICTSQRQVPTEMDSAIRMFHRRNGLDPTRSELLRYGNLMKAIKEGSKLCPRRRTLEVTSKGSKTSAEKFQKIRIKEAKSSRFERDLAPSCEASSALDCKKGLAASTDSQELIRRYKKYIPPYQLAKFVYDAKQKLYKVRHRSDIIETRLICLNPSPNSLQGKAAPCVAPGRKLSRSKLKARVKWNSLDLGAKSKGSPGRAKKSRVKKVKSRELYAGKVYTDCDCYHRNGLQHDCPRTSCGGHARVLFDARDFQTTFFTPEEKRDLIREVGRAEVARRRIEFRTNADGFLSERNGVAVQRRAKRESKMERGGIEEVESKKDQGRTKSSTCDRTSLARAFQVTDYPLVE